MFSFPMHRNHTGILNSGVFKYLDFPDRVLSAKLDVSSLPSRNLIASSLWANSSCKPACLFITFANSHFVELYWKRIPISKNQNYISLLHSYIYTLITNIYLYQMWSNWNKNFEYTKPIKLVSKEYQDLKNLFCKWYHLKRH